MRWFYFYFYILRGKSLPSFSLGAEFLISKKPKSPTHLFSSPYFLCEGKLPLEIEFCFPAAAKNSLRIPHGCGLFVFIKKKNKPKTKPHFCQVILCLETPTNNTVLSMLKSLVMF